MIIFNVANGDNSAYYSAGYETRAEAMELLRIALEHDPRAHVVEYERQTEVERLRAELEQVKRERDAAVEDLRGYCNVCAHWNCGFMEDACEDCKHSHPFDDDTFESDNWQWRGVKEDAT